MKKQITIMAILFIAILLLIPCVSKADNSYNDEFDEPPLGNGAYLVDRIRYDIVSKTDKTVTTFSIENSEFIDSIEIPSSIEIKGETYTVIGIGSLGSCPTIKRITLPDTITSIGDYAFSGWTGLTNIAIPNSVTKIGDNAFNGCDNLTSVTIPNSAISIGDYAFCACNGLTNLPLTDTVTSISNGMFQWCTGLTNITIPNSVTNIGNNAFRGCDNLTSVTIPNGITQINGETFSICRNLENVVIPNSVKAIALNAFDNSPKVVINTYSGAYAETFAKENNIKYKLLDGTEPETPDNTKVGYVTIGGNGYTLTGAEVVNTSDIYAEMKAKLNEKGYKTVYCAYELTATGADIQNGVELTFDVGTSNNGKQVMILHKKADGTFEDFTRTVSNGKVTITVTEFSPFMLAIKETTTGGSSGGSSSSGSSSSGSSNTGTSNNGGNTNNSNNGNNDNSNDNKQDIKNDKDTNNSNNKNDKLDNTPQTGDKINIAFIILAISIVCTIVSIIAIKKKNAEA